MISNEDKASKRKINQVTVIWGIMAILTVIPIIVASEYSVYSADDFSHSSGVGVFGGNMWELFVASLRYTKRMYLVWQGTYTSMFLQAFLSPLNGFGYMQLRAVMVFNAVLFIISLKVLISAICKSLYIDVGRLWIFFSICVMGIFAFTSWQEIFYWFSGAVSYSFPMSFSHMSDWINNAIAVYYHKISVQYVSSPLYVQTDGQKNIRISPETFGSRTGYASIFKIDNATQTTEALCVLQPFDSNMIISMGKEESGTVGIYLFADCEGKEHIDSLEVDY